MLRVSRKRACAVSVVVAVLISVAWSVSYLRAFEWRSGFSVGHRRTSVILYRGLISTMVIDDMPIAERTRFASYPSDSVRRTWWDEQHWTGSLAGFSLGDGTAWVHIGNGTSVSRDWRNFAFPLWAAFTLALLIPARAGCIAWTGSRRVARGQCSVCGYDLGGAITACPACEARSHVIGAGPRLRLISPV